MSYLKWALELNNVHLSKRHTSLAKDSVANVSLIVSIDRVCLPERVGRFPPSKLDLLLSAIDVVPGRQ